MIKAPKVEIATFFTRSGLSKTLRSIVPVIFSMILSVLFLGVPLAGRARVWPMLKTIVSFTDLHKKSPIIHESGTHVIEQGATVW